MTVKLRQKKLASGNLSLYLDLYQNGQRQYEFLGMYLTKDKAADKQTLALAENIRAKRQLEIQHSEHGFIPHFKKKISFVDYFEKLVLSQPKGEKAWPNTLIHLRRFTGGRLAFASVTAEWLETFKAHLLTQVSQNTAHLYFCKVKTALRRAVKDRIITTNPADLVDHIRTQDVERVFLTLGELQNLASTPCPDQEVKRAFLFACYTGLRFSDVRALLWENLKNDAIEFRQKKTGGFEYLPLSKMAKQILEDRNPKILSLQNVKVFRLPNSTKLGLTLRVWSKNAGINKPITFHVARHTFATLALTHGADLYTVSKLLGHKTIQATQIYAKIVDEKKKAAMEDLPMIQMK